MDNRYMLMILAALTAGTVITRFLPFLLFPQGRKVPRYVEYLGGTLPYATMGLLVVYSLQAPFGIPEILSCAAVALLHVLKRNSLLSIGAGTELYMVLVQAVF